jgi:thioredoxin-related protein
VKILSLKKKFILLAFTFLCNTLFAQTATDSLPRYKRIPIVPPFKLVIAPDSVFFIKDKLKKKRATVVMVFSPDCDHCVHSIEDLLAHYDLFKKAQIVMATSLTYSHVKKFYTDLKLEDYPNIKVGTDAAYFLGGFYDVRIYPAIFLYDKKGNFKKAFDGNTKWETIAASL